ncbi:tRNA pseudouridine32 synthase/23S rRNA pseudouridine746 synthase [Leucobacter luti]|uniref:RNA pseudouridylate synthase n=1 Tax=Leucobacter luti TaxID=340320 RepID=A0A4R6S3P3_9MICO|nr:pseudouridine synthase [Leucobacter luti]TDP94262.1 tRNA pseudouridine32 synthase/23S rRNA pseudouridine746 synthase [Leucobacter luti]
MPPRSPLPPRLGLDAAWLCTEDKDGGAPRPWPLMRDWLVHRVGAHIDVDAFIAEGRFVTESGAPVRASDPYAPHTFVWFHRELREEAAVPGEVRVIARDERIVVLDKPPFLASIPRGRHVSESVVVRMRHELGLPELTPMHRLDRITSGLLLMATERRWRGAYQSMFMRGEVTKTYHAVAAIREDLALPVTVRNHLTKTRGVWQAAVDPDAAPNSESLIELERELNPAEEAVLGEGPRRGIYRLTPRTGKTHQLRMHLWGLGIPIEGDPLYPTVLDAPVDDFSTPLQLLASGLRFTDPVDGTARTFASTRELPVQGTSHTT